MKFEEKMARLEEISELIRSGDPEFSKQLELFREGAALADDIEKELSRAEQIIEEINTTESSQN